MPSRPDFAKFVAKDKELKKQVVKEVIVSTCTSDEALADKFQAIQVVRDSVRKNGSDCLKVDILSDGMTNYGYKIYLEDDKDELKHAMFGKLAFPFALWSTTTDDNDDVGHYDIRRLDNEVIIMKQFDELLYKHNYGNVVPTHFFNIGIDNDRMRLMVTGWCHKNDVPHHEQLRAGKMDQRLAPKLGTSLAKLHCVTDFDPHFNEFSREPLVKSIANHRFLILKQLENTTQDASRTAVALRAIGRERLLSALDVLYDEMVHVRTSLIHGDFHSYNILTEPKNDTDDKFGPNGSFVVVDWEMAHAGPAGRDVGLFQGFVLLFALAHAINGNYPASDDLLSFVDNMWDAYEQELRAGGRDDEFLLETARSTMGWCGWNFLAIYLNEIHSTVFPLNYEKDGDLFRDALGHVTHQFFLIGFGGGGDDTASLSTVPEYRQKIKDIYVAEIEYIKSCNRFS